MVDISSARMDLMSETPKPGLRDLGRKIFGRTKENLDHLLKRKNRQQAKQTEMSSNPGEQVALPPVGEFQSQVNEAHRRLSKPPMKEMYYKNVKPSREIDEILDKADNSIEMKLKFEVHDGRRLIIDGIPVTALVSGNLTAERSIQVFRNPEGYLVAEEVVVDQDGNPKNNRGGKVILERTADGHVVLQGIIPDSQVKDNLKSDLPDRSVELLDVEYKWPKGGGSYSSVHISITSPSDEGNDVDISLTGFPNKLPEAIKFREVDEVL